MLKDERKKVTTRISLNSFKPCKVHSPDSNGNKVLGQENLPDYFIVSTRLTRDSHPLYSKAITPVLLSK